MTSNNFFAFIFIVIIRNKRLVLIIEESGIFFFFFFLAFRRSNIITIQIANISSIKQLYLLPAISFRYKFNQHSKCFRPS